MEVKKIPHSLEAEQGLIGALVIDSEKIKDVSSTIMPFYFYNQINKIIYEEIIDLYNQKQEVDLILLKAHLEAKNKILDIGGINYIINIVDAVDSSEMSNIYANVIYEKYIMREIIQKASNILHEAYQASDSQELLEYAEKEIFDLSKLARSEDFVDWQGLLTQTHDKILELASQEKKGLIGLSTGYSILDNMLSGLQKSDLLILAARPSVGKTAFALNLAKNVAKASANNQASVAIFSLEMSAEQLLYRILAAESTVPIGNIKQGTLTIEEQQMISFAVDNLSQYNIFIDDTAGIKIGELKSKARKLKVEQGLDFIVIDYLQLITTASRSDSRQQEVSEISRELKGLAKELEIPILSLSQLSRGVEQRQNKKPMMSDIRESGAIEQDADIIMMLYRPEYYANNLEEGMEEEVYDGKTELIITKHRNGSTGTLEYKFVKEINKFTQVIRDDNE
ncbi:MAG: replicative DNA helicase [Mycoplasmatales bacterium]